MLSTAWNSRRGSQSYIEKRRGRKETEVSRTRRWGAKRKETGLASSQFPKCSAQPRTPRDSQHWVEKRQGREEIEATCGKKMSQKGERATKPVTTLPSKNGHWRFHS